MPPDRDLLIRRKSCQHCGGTLTGRQAKWCSENCRKRACDDAHRARCQDCGGPMAARTGWSRLDGENARCITCEKRLRLAGRRLKLEDVACMYREGKLIREIAAALGYGENSTPPEINACFKNGLLTDADRRYPKERVAAMTRGRWAA